MATNGTAATATNERGIQTGVFRRFAPVLNTWVAELDNRSWAIEKDPAWWYNERAILSLFAGAVWQEDGWAFEEFASSKRKAGVRDRRTGIGRSDLLVWIRGRYYAIEAKHCYPSLSGKNPVGVVEKHMKRALADIRRTPIDESTQRVGLVFAAPCIATTRCHAWSSQLRTFLEGLKRYRLKYRGALAWTFPRWGLQMRHTESDGREYAYPGGVLLMRQL